MEALAQNLLLLPLAMLVITAAALTVFDLTQRTYLGFQWWAAALWLNAVAAALLATFETPLRWLPLVQLLFVPWPVLGLMGLRRFHARMALTGNERIDIGMLAALCGCAAIALLAAGEASAVWWVPHAAAAVALLYSAVIAGLAPHGRDAGGVRTLAGLWLLVALQPLLTLVVLQDGEAAARLQASVVATGSLVMAFAVLGLSSQRTERELLNSRRRLRVLANIDMLTQVPNRRRFEELARRALQADKPGSAALLLLDIDHFKQINDKLGHAAGDRALKLVSRCTLDLLRAHDVAGRHGGDEFVLLLRRSSTKEAMQVAERLVARLQTQAHAHALPRLGLSFGIVQMRSGESIDETLQRADQALYEAKRLGRCRAVAADGGDDDNPVFHSSERLGLTSS